jgi:hypothetical protein
LDARYSPVDVYQQVDLPDVRVAQSTLLFFFIRVVGASVFFGSFFLLPWNHVIGQEPLHTLVLDALKALLQMDGLSQYADLPSIDHAYLPMTCMSTFHEQATDCTTSRYVTRMELRIDQSCSPNLPRF